MINNLRHTNIMRLFLIMCISLFGFSISAFAQDIVEVTGVVKDSHNEPLIGVSIAISNTAGLGTTTNIDGQYKIKVERYSKLIFSYIGFNKQEIMVKDQTVIDVTLKESEASALTEVVITGTGVQEKVTVTGAITTVNTKDLKSNPTGSISNSLAGNVPGVLAMRTSGKPGSKSEFWIRGISTFGGNSKALVLVDGFERELDELNVEDIEDFTVLKDASATAIYGSKGANGVILIKTKRGEAGKIKINAKLETAYNTLTQVPKFVDGYRYASLMNEARITRNQEPMLRPDEMEILRLGLDPDLYPNVNWKNQLLKDGAMSGRVSVDLQGGGNTARYFASASYFDQEGIYKIDKTMKDYNTNANFRRWNYRLNTDIDITKTTILELGISGSLEKENDTGLGSDMLWNSIMFYNPILTPVMYSDGKVPAFGTGDQTNPYVLATQTGYREKWKNNIQTNATLKQDLNFVTEGLSFVGRFGYDTENSTEIQRKKHPEQWKAERFRNITTGEIEFKRVVEAQEMVQWSGSGGNRHEFFEAELHYGRGFNGHHIGGTAKYSQSSKVQTVNLGDDLKNGIAFRNQALAGRVTYRWNYRYFTEFNFGYTGSENFANGHQFGFFPAISGGWNIADEPIIKNSLGSWLDLFKVRYSWGKVGNDVLGARREDNRFPYLYTIEHTDNGYNFGDFNFPNVYGGRRYSQVASPYVTWEKATKHDVGLDVSAFGDKFSFTVDYFNETRDGIFMSRDFLPAMVGIDVSSPKANVGKVTSKGFDGHFALHHKVKNVNLTLRGNITYSKNKTLERDEENNYYAYRMWKGYRVDQAWGLIAEGLFKDWDDIRNSPRQDLGSDVMPGDIKYKDVNGDGVINGDDEVAIGSTTKPNMVYGFATAASWNGLDVNVHFQGAGKSTFFIDGPTVHMFAAGQWGNVLTDMANSNRWVSKEISGNPATENPNAEYPRLSFGGNGNNYRKSTYWQRDGSYLRLKTVDIGYTLPKQLVNKFSINNVRVFFIGTNLLTWSSFKLWDPEMGSSNGIKYPNAKTYSFGLSINI